jgi:hypothetical protein
MAVLPVYETRQLTNPKEEHANLPAIDTKIPKGRNTKIYCFLPYKLRLKMGRGA